MTLAVILSQNFTYSYGQTITESTTQPGLMVENIPSEKVPRLCESPSQPGLFVPCELPSIGGNTNTDFCESESQPGLFILCYKPSPTPVSYCESPSQPGLMVICIKTDEKKETDISSLTERIIKLENQISNITSVLNSIKQNQTQMQNQNMSAN
jgi:hypothetical protein